MAVQIDRRELLRAGMLGAPFAVAGCEQLGGDERSGDSDESGFECDSDLSPEVYEEFVGETGWFEEAPARWYCAMWGTLQALKQPWLGDPYGYLQNYEEVLLRSLEDIVVPGVEDALPVPSVIDNTRQIVDVVATTFEQLDRAYEGLATTDYKAAFNRQIIGGSTQQPREPFVGLYAEIGLAEIGTGTDLVTPLFDALVMPLDRYHDGGQERREALQQARHNAETVTRIFGALTLPRTAYDDKPLRENLRLLDRLAALLRETAAYDLSEGISEGDNRGDPSGGEPITVNAAANGGEASVTQPTWEYKEERDIGPRAMIDQDEGTHWQVRGQPDEIYAVFTCRQRARVVGDYLDIGGTGGGRDVTEYELYARDSPDESWSLAKTFTGSVTADGDGTISHDFPDDPVSGKQFRLVITEHEPPSGCLSSCDVPVREYHLLGRFV